MKFPGNIFYYLKSKKNNLLPASLKHLFYLDEVPNTFTQVSEYRRELHDSGILIDVADFGAGSKNMKSKLRKVSDIVKNSSSSEEFGIFYQKLIKEFDISNILELGTSLGIGTMYFCLAENNTNVVTIEACPNTFNLAKRNFKKKGIKNVEFINSTFDDVFQDKILEGKKFDLVFIDGNHKSKSVLEYYDYISKNLATKKSIYIIDDINWTSDMYKAWKFLCQENKHNFVLNMGRMGVVFDSYDNLPSGNFPISFVKSKKM